MRSVLMQSCGVAGAQGSQDCLIYIQRTPVHHRALQRHSTALRCLELSKRAQREYQTKRYLERNIILHRAPQIHPLDIPLQLSIRYEMNPVMLRRLHTRDQEADEDDEGFREDAQPQSSD